MEVAMPMAGSAIDCYEDMFKEITRKLYGEETLPDLSTTERIPSTGTDRGLTPIDYEVDPPMLKPEEHLTAFGLAALMQNGFPATGILNSTFPTHKSTMSLALANAPQEEDKWISSEESLQWTQSKVATYNPSQKLFRCADCESVGYLNRVAEHWLGTHSNLRAFHCPQCSYESAWARCVRIHLGRQHNINIDESCDALTKDNPVLQDIVKFLHRLKSKIDNSSGSTKASSAPGSNQTVTSDEFQNMAGSSTSQGNLSQPSTSAISGNSSDGSSATSKRYSCTYCPYATDRRDLFTRHENIHREEKPFQCYVCQKQFNRADHVKKHFLRMHRDHPYDLNRIRRHPPKNASGMSYYQKYNSNSTVVSAQQEAINTLSTISTLGISGFSGIPRTPTVPAIKPPEVKTIPIAGKPATVTSKSGKKKGEKRFSCCYCSWSGVDNWCLKRHMNTHLKPFICVLCDYKAARSERLATHVLKVHNKRACGKCNFLADDLAQMTAHQQEQHPLESRNRALTGMPSGSVTSSIPTNTSNILRANGFNRGSSPPSATITSSSAASNSSSSSGTSINNTQPQSILKSTDLTTAAAQILHHNRFLQTEVKSWKSPLPKQHGAARLFSYMEASDGSDQESEAQARSNTTPANMTTRVNLTHRIQSDFLEAGGVDQSQQEAEEQIVSEETELPLFVCQSCGCEFEDDLSLETHQITHRHVATSPVKSEDIKENVDPYRKYSCKLCDASFESQNSIIAHMAVHTNLATKPVVLPTPISYSKRSRKQSKPKKVVVPYWESDEVEVLRHLSGKLRKWKGYLSTENSGGISKLVDKYMAQLVTRRGLTCKICRNAGISRYHTKASLTLHHYWKHSRRRFPCEHCNMTFKHRYQTILHSSRVHTEQPVTPQVLPPPVPPHSNKINVISNLTVQLPQIKEPTHISLENVSATDLNSFTNFFNSSHNIAVPDAMSNAHKLGMSFFDHSFIQNNVVNNHMPIIIPGFQPN
ncbi:protein charlatan [Anthonomus grandis grandis]|uniref:protein charlatan n=1 Tax=Anthonomus grandis grandis TaxID=2921223 RepID=UPI0021669105|nr:protein charlatan [Anthonomus grandis grandis]